jgi:hypothetical protein
VHAPDGAHSLKIATNLNVANYLTISIESRDVDGLNLLKQNIDTQTRKIILVFKTVHSLANILCMRQSGLILSGLKIVTNLKVANCFKIFI